VVARSWVALTDVEDARVQEIARARGLSRAKATRVMLEEAAAKANRTVAASSRYTQQDVNRVRKHERDLADARVYILMNSPYWKGGPPSC